jgi:hypothetical protein
MKYFKIARWFLGILMITVFNSCDKCEGKKNEPLMKVYFYQNNQIIDPQYDQVYGLDQNNQPKSDLLLDKQEQAYVLPISALADQVVYVFRKANQPTDTLIVNYTRKFEYQNKKCGMEMFIPSAQMSPKSTLKPFVDNSFQGLEIFQNEVRLYISI